MPRQFAVCPLYSILPLLLVLASVPAAWGQAGVVLTGVGPINRSMGGAAVAAPIDSAGALYWNPASITGLDRSEMEFGLELINPHTTLSSQVPANALGPGQPPTAAFGSDDGQNGIFPLPTLGLVYRPEDSPLVLGLGVFAVGGFGVNYPASANNPILQAPPLIGLGVGPIYTELTVMQVAPTAAYQLTDRLSVGLAPTLTLASLRLDPAIVAPPDHPGGTDFVSFPRSANSRIRVGGGVQGGVYYTMPEGWQFGASLKSPQWLETFHFNTINAAGRPLNVPFSFDYPLIASLGVGYSGIEHWLFAVDCRYIDYGNTDGFRQGGFGPDGRVLGVGFRSILAVAAGVQYQWTDSLSVRLGYSYNQDPVPNPKDDFNPVATIDAAAPTIIQHTVYVGASWRVSEALSLSAAYVHGFENSLSGIYRGPAIIVPGSTIRTEASADTFLVGATVQFGCARK